MKSLVAVVVFALGCVTVSQAADADVQFLNADPAFKGLPFSEAVRVGSLIYLSGQLGNEPGAMKLVPGGIQAETRQTMENLKHTLASFGYSTADLVKCTVMLADMKEWSAFNDVYRTYFKDHFPARIAVGVNGLLLNARVELDCVAARPVESSSPR